MEEKALINAEEVTFVNGVISALNIEIIGHYGNVVTMTLLVDCAEGTYRLFNGRALTLSLGFLLKALYETIKDGTDDKVNIIKELEKAPVRLIIRNGECIGVANFFKNRYLIEEQFLNDTLEMCKKLFNSK